MQDENLTTVKLIFLNCLVLSALSKLLRTQNILKIVQFMISD